MVERLLLAGLIIALGWLAYQLFLRWQRRKATVALGTLENRLPGRPLILYFTQANCVPCRTIQAPALRAIEAELGAGVQIITYDADQRPDLARVWGVMSVPTTFVFSASDRLLAYNPGVAHVAKLRQQLAQAA